MKQCMALTSPKAVFRFWITPTRATPKPKPSGIWYILSLPLPKLERERNDVFIILHTIYISTQQSIYASISPIFRGYKTWYLPFSPTPPGVVDISGAQALVVGAHCQPFWRTGAEGMGIFGAQALPVGAVAAHDSSTFQPGCLQVC